MAHNPYEPPPTELQSNVPQQIPRSTWPLWIAVSWIIFLALYVPSIWVSRYRPPPAGTFLTVQITTTIFSIAAVFALLSRPRKRWLLMTIPVTYLLFMLQRHLWQLP